MFIQTINTVMIDISITNYNIAALKCKLPILMNFLNVYL